MGQDKRLLLARVYVALASAITLLNHLVQSNYGVRLLKVGINSFTVCHHPYCALCGVECYVIVVDSACSFEYTMFIVFSSIWPIGLGHQTQCILDGEQNIVPIYNYLGFLTKYLMLCKTKYYISTFEVLSRCIPTPDKTYVRRARFVNTTQQWDQSHLTFVCNDNPDFLLTPLMFITQQCSSPELNRIACLPYLPRVFIQ